ncbi:MAG: ABC transporter permease [Anaerolineae bacterium]|nr:ABC transporter permease [Anaerolineae bacterium]
MSLRDLLGLVLLNLNRMRSRVVMTAMGVVVGTAAIVVLISLASGLQASTVESFEDFGSLNQITVFSSARMGGDSSAEGLTADALDDLASIDGVVAITPYESLNGGSLSYNRLSGFASIYGIDPDVIENMDFVMTEGDDNIGNYTVIVGSDVGSRFSEDGDSGGGGGFGPMMMMGGQDDSTDTEDAIDLMGKTITLELTRRDDDGDEETHKVRLRVGGVIESSGGQEDYNLYMSIDDVEDLTAWKNGERPDWEDEGYSQAIVIAEQDAEITLEVTDEIENRGYFAMSTTSIVEALNSTFMIIEAVLGGVASIALFVAAIGIANTMIMSVLERTREVGLMKAVGATNRDVLSVFLTEAAFIGLIGGVVGIILGIVGAQIIDVFAASYLASSGSDITSVVVTPLWLPIGAMIFSVLIGLGAGIYPAFRAVQLDPVMALKYE